MRDFIDMINAAEFPMRNLIAIYEDVQTDWFQKGRKIAISEWPDLADFLEYHEFDLDWRLCDVPAEIITNSILDPEEANTRMGEITAWLNDGGTITDSPPLGVYTGERFWIFDGNHRIEVMKRRGEATVPMVVAIDPDFNGW